MYPMYSGVFLGNEIGKRTVGLQCLTQNIAIVITYEAL